VIFPKEYSTPSFARLVSHPKNFLRR